jgi:hypothetical protein
MKIYVRVEVVFHALRHGMRVGLGGLNIDNRKIKFCMLMIFSYLKIPIRKYIAYTVSVPLLH